MNIDWSSYIKNKLLKEQEIDIFSPLDILQWRVETITALLV